MGQCKALRRAEWSNRYSLRVLFGGGVSYVTVYVLLLYYVRASFVVGDAGNSQGSVCLAKWSGGSFTSTKRCIELELPPIVLDDGVVYIANGLLLPDDLQDEVNQLV